MQNIDPHTPPQSRGAPLLPFSVTPPRPPGPSEAERKVEALTRELEEEMEKKEQLSEFFGACHACSEKVTGAGQACQVTQIMSYISYTVHTQYIARSSTLHIIDIFSMTKYKSIFVQVFDIYIYIYIYISKITQIAL